MRNRRMSSESAEERQLREAMVAAQLQARGIDDPRVLGAFREIPRSHFCPPQTPMSEVYGDFPLALGRGQTISQPYMVALMTSLLELRGEERVLEIGTGSGYQAAILGCLAARVDSVERIPELAETAQAALRGLCLDNVHVRVGDGTLGWPRNAPYEAVLITAAAPEPPASLLGQLADGGRMVLPVGSRASQRLLRLRRRRGRIEREWHDLCVFVPLIGEQGWPE